MLTPGVADALWGTGLRLLCSNEWGEWRCPVIGDSHYTSLPSPGSRYRQIGPVNCTWSGRSRPLQQRGEGKKEKAESKDVILYMHICRCTWGGDIENDIEETGWEFVDWIHLAHDRYEWWDLENTERVLGSRKCRTFNWELLRLCDVQLVWQIDR